MTWPEAFAISVPIICLVVFLWKFMHEVGKEN